MEQFTYTRKRFFRTAGLAAAGSLILRKNTGWGEGQCTVCSYRLSKSYFGTQSYSTHEKMKD